MSAIIGGAISAGIGLAGSVYGGIKAGQQRRAMESYLTQQEGEAASQFNRDYYGDYTKRADTLAMINNMRQELARRTGVTQAASAITGATPEAALAEGEQNAKIVGDTYSQVASIGQQYKDRVMDTYQSRKYALQGMKYNSMEGAAQGYENVMMNSLESMGKGVGSIANSLLPADDVAENVVKGI